MFTTVRAEQERTKLYKWTQLPRAGIKMCDYM